VAIFHLSAHERVSRSAGQSSVASAAYVMRAQFNDERTGQVYDFRHLDMPQWVGMFSPKDAPDWTREAANAERFWNALELFEKRRDAQIALPLDIALPFEMTQQQNVWLAQDYIRETFTRNGYVVLAAIHPPDHDERNIHLHLLVSLRKIDAHGFARTKTEQQENYRNRDAYIENLREKWEHLANRHLERHGIDARIDRRTLQEQGIDRDAQTHRGPTKSAVVFLQQDRETRAAAVAEIKSQFTSDDFTGTLQRHGVTISMDGKGRYMDNIFVERLWRSLKYEEVYLNAYASVDEAKAGIGSWLGFYNQERQHQSLGYRTPRQAYEAECPWLCGRSASPTGRASAHIPTGTTPNHKIDIDEEEHKSNAMTVAPGAIGAGTEIGRATP
jgi:MobA/MobL family/Integrase core domain